MLGANDGIVSTASLMTGIADGQREGWSSDTIVLRLTAGAVAAVAFVLWELHTPRAMLDVRIFKNIEFSAAAMIAFILDHGEAKAVLVDTEFAPVMREALAKCKVKPLVIDIADPAAPCHDRIGSLEYEELLAEGDPELARRALTPEALLKQVWSAVWRHLLRRG